jgi:hypothetical protein
MGQKPRQASTDDINSHRELTPGQAGQCDSLGGRQAGHEIEQMRACDGVIVFSVFLGLSVCVFGSILQHSEPQNRIDGG